MKPDAGGQAGVRAGGSGHANGTGASGGIAASGSGIRPWIESDGIGVRMGGIAGQDDAYGRMISSRSIFCVIIPVYSRILSSTRDEPYFKVLFSGSAGCAGAFCEFPGLGPGRN